MSEAFDIDALLKRHPLPWGAVPLNLRLYVVRDADGNRVCDHNLSEINARLLAAAPGMVKAIRDHADAAERRVGQWCDDHLDALKASLP